jgi:tetratricopeptide (TPR) repeat protein
MKENLINSEIQKIISLYKNQNFKKALLEANLTRVKYQQLETSNFYLNLIGLINLALKDWQNSILFFNKAIQLNPKVLDPYYNLGIAYYDMGELIKSLEFFLKVYENSKDKKSKFAIIKILSYINPIKHFDNTLININNKIQLIDSRINFSEKITDKFILDMINKCKSESEELDNFEFNEDQVYRRNEIDLNCERHKRIFNKFNTIPKFCFNCIKIVIFLDDPYDLIRLVLFFDQYENLFKFDRKCMIEKQNEKFKAYIYFDSIELAKKVSKEITPIMEVLVGQKIKYEIKRGCSEYAVKYPDFKDINQNMTYPKEWSVNEEKSDNDSFKDGIPITRNKQKSLSGLTLSDFLIFNKWLN